MPLIGWKDAVRERLAAFKQETTLSPEEIIRMVSSETGVQQSLVQEVWEDEFFEEPDLGYQPTTPVEKDTYGRIVDGQFLTYHYQFGIQKGWVL